MGRGGETAGGGATSFVAFFAFAKMGASLRTSSSGADDSELSESESMVGNGGRKFRVGGE